MREASLIASALLRLRFAPGQRGSCKSRNSELLVNGASKRRSFRRSWACRGPSPWRCRRSACPLLHDVFGFTAVTVLEGSVLVVFGTGFAFEANMRLWAQQLFMKLCAQQLFSMLRPVSRRGGDHRSGPCDDGNASSHPGCW